MKATWKLQDAKAKFSKVVDDALKTGPQHITRRG
ncbi:MAG: type II toxin-antitoxin system prevent-host-death family antitoxin, partial [Thermodesulfobacteriota bacterium]|nr:type II toxin-antitoxin system prevent-host-death family antitoxin [Thermodesulfobacteriota bacterium]